MVPHRKTLQVIALSTLASQDPVKLRDDMCRMLNVVFPCTTEEFLNKDVFPWITPDAETLLRTSDMTLLFDYRPLFAAAKQLGIATYLCVSAEGPTYNLPSSLVKWRDNKNLRIFIETSLLCEIDAEQISDDVNRMYGLNSLPEDIKLFELLFMDREYAFGDNWLSYMFCVGDEEAKFKQSMIGEPTDYVRWKLGVPVTLDSDHIVDRMLSDAYFSLRMVKAKVDVTATPTKDQLARLKLEHDTIFKALDRRVKLKELSNASGSGADSSDAAAQIQRIILEFKDHQHTKKADLVDGPPATLADLNKGDANGNP